MTERMFEGEKRTSEVGSARDLELDFRETHPRPLRTRKHIWPVGCLIVLMAFPLHAQQRSASTTAQLILVVPSRARVSVPAKVAFEETQGGLWNSEVSVRAIARVSVRMNKPARGILTAEWNVLMSATPRAQGKAGGDAAQQRPGFRGFHFARSWSLSRPFSMRVRTRAVQDGDGLIQVSGTSLSGLNISSYGGFSAPSWNGLRFAPGRDLSAGSPASLSDLQAVGKSDFGLDVEFSLPSEISLPLLVTVTFTVL